MSETKQPYQKPEVNSEDLSFEPVEFHYTPMSYSDSIKKAKSTTGIEIYKKQRRTGMGEQEKETLNHLNEKGVAVEIPFKGGKLDEIVTLSAGEALFNVFERLDRKEQDQIVEKLGMEIAKMHNAGIVHADLEPINILVNSSGDIVFIDFERKRKIPNLNECDPSLVEDTIELLKDDVVCITDFSDLKKFQKIKLIKIYMENINIKNPEIKNELKSRIFDSLF